MIHLSSLDVATGSRYNGTYTFDKSIIGSFKMIYQYFSNFDDVPWCYEGCNTLFLENFNDFEQQTTIEFPQITDDDEASVRAWFAAGIATTGWVTISSSSYDSATNIYTFIFSGPILIRTAVEDSSIGYVFNWIYADPLAPINEPNNDTIHIDGKYINKNPRILELQCPQVQSEAVNAHGDSPTLFISTKESFAVQEIEVLSEVSSLSLTLHRPNNPAILPVTEHFDLILKPI